MTDYSKFVDKYFKKADKPIETLAHAALGLCGEAGEVTDMIKKAWIYGKIINRDEMIKELGDVFFYYQAMMNHFGVTLEQVIQANTDKIQKRYPEGYSDESAIKRLDKKE